MKAVGRINQDTVKAFAQESIVPGQTLHTDAFAALRVLAEGYHPVGKVTPPELSMNGCRGNILSSVTSKAMCPAPAMAYQDITCRDTWTSFATG
jgi:hypothetical protein